MPGRAGAWLSWAVAPLALLGYAAYLGALYAGVVLGFGQLFGGVGAAPPNWLVAGATLAVAAVFQPA